MPALKPARAAADRCLMIAGRLTGQFPPYWWLRRARRRGRDRLVNYGHCTVCRSMWFVSDAWDVGEAVRTARHRSWCLVRFSRRRASAAA
jgi:hypothetical protein